MINQDTSLIDLQTQLAFQEDELSKMSDALYQQQLRTDALELLVIKLRDELQQLQQRPAGAAADIGNEVPPHY